MNLTHFSVKNYQFTLVIFIMVALVGLVTIFTMPRAEDPQINPPTFPIVVVYPGTSPQDLEELVVKPIEEKIYELDNIDKITSSIEDGLAIIKAEFKYGVNVDNKYQEVIREVNNLRNNLPPDIFSIDIRKVDPSDVTILQVALISETASYANLKKQAELLQSKLEKVSNLQRHPDCALRNSIGRDRRDNDVVDNGKSNVVYRHHRLHRTSRYRSKKLNLIGRLYQSIAQRRSALEQGN
jgi:multidrug efflux pump subunit AcrB